jgi:hypothetical protein
MDAEKLENEPGQKNSMPKGNHLEDFIVKELKGVQIK